MTQFWNDNGVNASLANIDMINVGGGTLPAPEGEETLDTSWTSGIAPGAKIRIYATGSLQFPAIDQGLDTILSDLATQPSMRQLSISMGLGETFYAAGEMRTQQQKYLRLAAAGINVFISSGDAGSNPDPTGQNSDGPLQVEYAASDPNVICVGGTTLVLGPTARFPMKPLGPAAVAGKANLSAVLYGRLARARLPAQSGSCLTSVLPRIPQTVFS